MNRQRSFKKDDKGSLYLIPTPIGNINDISLRAIETLKSVSLILCEDTRESLKLLKKIGVSNKLVSSNEQNEVTRIEMVTNLLSLNEDVGLISDRGTPTISDPGYELVRAVLKEGYKVISLPGPTAITTALSASGLEPEPFYFHGFLRGNNNKKKKTLESLKNMEATLIFYEAPHHLLTTLNLMNEVFGNRKVVLARELTKLYEEYTRGTLDDICANMNQDLVKGEYVILVERGSSNIDFSGLSINEHVNMYIEEGKSQMDAIKMVASDLDKPKSEIYKIYHRG